MHYFLRTMFCVMAFAGCRERAPEPLPPLPSTPEPVYIDIPYNVHKGKEYFEQKRLEVKITQTPWNTLQVQWKYTEDELNAQKYGDKVNFIATFTENELVAKKPKTLYSSEDEVGLLEDKYWQDDFTVDLWEFHAVPKGKQSVSLLIQLSSSGKTICEAHLLLHLDLPAIYKTTLSVKNIALTDEGCAQIGDETFIFSSKKTYPDLMFMVMADKGGIRYSSEVFKNTCHIEEEIIFDVYHFDANEKVILHLYDRDYGFNPTDEIAFWELQLADFQSNDYKEIGNKPNKFFDVKNNPIKTLQLKANAKGLCNAAGAGN